MWGYPVFRVPTVALEPTLGEVTNPDGTIISSLLLVVVDLSRSLAVQGQRSCRMLRGGAPGGGVGGLGAPTT
jgi:hypothetical protein